MALTGLGGIGKTQLAVQHAHRHAADYGLVWWLAADQPLTLVSGLADLAHRLRLDEARPGDQPAAAEAARRWLEQHEQWLLAFDNAAEPHLVRPWLPGGDTGHTLITSRFVAWGGTAHRTRLQPLDAEHSARLLQQRSGQDNPAAARALAGRLGGLPLALEQAGAYMEATETPLADYLQLLETRSTALLAYATDDETRSVAATWEPSFQKLRERAPTSADLLSVAAFLAPEDLPRDLFVGNDTLPERLSPLSDALAFGDALAALARYSLITPTADAFAVHRLVQDTTRDRMTVPDQQTWTQTAVALLDAAFPSDVDELADPQRWPRCARLLPHLLAAAEHARETTVAEAIAAALLRRGGSYLEHRGDYLAARGRLEHALALVEGARGPDHIEVAYVLDALGYLLLNQGDLAGARANLERALAINERVLGGDDPAVGRTLNVLGRVLGDQCDLAGACAHLDRALAISMAAPALGPDDPQVASILNNVGRVLRDQGDLAGAREHHERALAIKEAACALGPNHPSVGSTLDLLGRVVGDQGDLADARSYLERALVIKEAALGPNHPEVAITCWWLGVVLQGQNDPLRGRAQLERAQATFERVLRLDEAAYGPDHPTVARDVNNLGAVLRDRGDLDGAQAAFERVLRLDEAAYGPDHPTVARDVNNLGAVLRDRGDLDGAQAAFERALAIFQIALRADHPFTATVRANLDALLQQ